MQNLSMISPVTESAQISNPDSIQIATSELKSDHSTPSPPGLDKPEPTSTEFTPTTNMTVRQSPGSISPDCSKPSFPTSNTPQPPPLDLSSLPTSPVRSNPESLAGAETHPVNKSELSPQSVTKHGLSSEDESNFPTAVVGVRTNSPASNTSEDTPTPSKTSNFEWLEAMQQYGQAAQAMKLNLNLINGLESFQFPDFKQIDDNSNTNTTSSSNNSNGAPLSPAEFTTRFQNMLSNLSQFIFNAQLPNLNKNLSRQKSPSSHGNISPNKSRDAPAIPKSQVEFGDSLCSPVPSVPLGGNLCSPNLMGSPLSTNLPTPPNDFNANSQSLALTASVLGLLTAQKQNGLQNMILDPNFNCNPKPYAAQCSSSSSCSTTSTSSCPSTQFHPVSTASPLSSMGFPGPDPIRGVDCKIPDPRDLLYQLGQQLMAMATSPNVGQLLPGQLDMWNPTMNDFKFMPPASFAPNNSAFLSPPPNHPMNLLSSTTGLNCIPNTGLDKGLGHMNTGSVPFSGISMRGNQKYSAYYQHQRKQTFQSGMTGDSGTNASMGRRQRNSLSPMSGARYGSRRLRSGNVNTPMGSPMLEPRAVQRFPGLRNQNSNQVQGVGAPGPIGAAMFPNFRTNAPYKFSGLGPTGAAALNTSKGGTTADASSLGPGAANVSTSPVSTRHRETAFLCSCGKDFDSLYVFTLHMKDTGHKPKSDQAERDIPKLVRGQDMWINSETEQTREILRCMRCHQSFRSLPELTMHMMKTNHYSEIVYNDSGRCVFVNPEEPRRGSCVSTSSVSSPGKPSTMWSSAGSGRRNSRQSNANWLNGLPPNSTAERLPNPVESDTSTANTNTSKASDTSLKSNTSASHEGHEEQIKKSRMEADKSRESRESVKWEQGSKSDSEELKPKEEELSKSPVQSRPSSSASTPANSSRNEDVKNSTSELAHLYADSSSEPNSGKSAGSVLQQIESFVENSLPRPNKSFPGKQDMSDHLSNRSGSPRSVTSGSEIPSTQSHTYSPQSSRKRTFSEATGSGTFSPMPSPIQDNDATMKDASSHLSDSKRQQNVPSISPPSSKVSSTTSEMSLSLTENPLSSLQKLVETTHKPVRSPLAFSVPSQSPLFTGYTNTTPPTKSFSMPKQMGMNNNTNNNNNNNSTTFANSNSSMRSPYSPSKSGSNTAPGSPYTPSANAQTPKIQPTSLSPPREADNNIVPALSALYAYVERSSSSQLAESQNGPKDELSSPSISDSIRTTNSDKVEDEATGHETTSSLPPNLNSGAPVLQAIYAAALSNLASQCLANQSSELPKVSTANDPLNAFKNAALNFKDALDSFGLRDVQNIEMTQQWLTMLRTLIESTNKTDQLTGSSHRTDPGTTQSPNELQRMSSRGSNGSNPDCSAINEKSFEDHIPSGARSQASPNSKASISPPLPSRSNNSPVNNSSHISQTTSIRANYPINTLSKPNTCNMATNNSNLGTSNCNMPTSMSSVINNARVSGALPNPLPNMPHPTYSTNATRPISQTGASSMMSTITKKAKCHFCGKPFANKGQVRLHISKNKCPCLLQQSCHAAALAAAFGSNTQRMSHPMNTKTDLANSSIHSNLNRNSNVNEGLQDLTMSTRQLKADDHGSSGNAPSALSLLKERFQNFDVNQNFQMSPDFASSSSATSTTGDFNSNSNNNSVNPAFNKQWMPPNMGSMLPVQSNPKTSSTNPSTAAAAAAANAGHLAAMALLAQTLVQLTANQQQQQQQLASQPLQSQQQQQAQAPNMFDSLAELSNSVGMPFLNPNMPPRGIQTSEPSANPDPNLNFSLDSFMQQVNLAKQLASVGWVPNAAVPPVPTNPDDNHRYSFGHVQGNRATTPNGLS